MTSTVGPTVVAERAGRRNLGFASGLALLALAILSPMLRTEPIETGTQIAIGALIQIAPPLEGAGADRPNALILGMAVLALVLTAINMFGGFAVTRRMLAMFRK